MNQCARLVGLGRTVFVERAKIHLVKANFLSFEAVSQCNGATDVYTMFWPFGSQKLLERAQLWGPCQAVATVQVDVSF